MKLKPGTVTLHVVHYADKVVVLGVLAGKREDKRFEQTFDHEPSWNDFVVGVGEAIAEMLLVE